MDKASASSRYLTNLLAASRGASEGVLLVLLTERNPLSVADALIAATAKLHDAVLAHKDPELAAPRGETELLSVPFKRGARQT